MGLASFDATTTITKSGANQGDTGQFATFNIFSYFSSRRKYVPSYCLTFPHIDHLKFYVNTDTMKQVLLY